MIPAPHAQGATHVALLYESVQEFADATVPFLRDGLRDGDALLMVSTPAPTAAVRDALPGKSLDSVTFVDSVDHYTTSAQALTAFQQLLFDCGASGRRLRVVSEPPLTLWPEDQVEELCLAEAAFNAVCDLPWVTLACAYDMRVTPEPLREQLVRSHPQVVRRGKATPSTTFADPATVLTESLTGPPLPSPTGPVASLVAPVDAAQAREFVERAGARTGLAGESLSRFVSAANEVVTNANSHAVLDSVRVWSERGRSVCEVRDVGDGLDDPLAGYRLPDLQSTSGRGLWMARQLTDLVEVRSGPRGSIFRLHLDGRAARRTCGGLT